MSQEKPSAAWIENFKAEVATFTTRGDYAGALPLVKKALKEFPNELQVRFNYAKILGDWANELPPARKKKLKADSIRILKPILRSLAGQKVETRFSICLNYYYQSESWKSMYAFGKRFERFHKQKAFYAQGLAATSLAFDAHVAGQLASAQRWAKSAIGAWRNYDFKKDDYYFPLYNYAKALAVAGEKKSAKQKLQSAAALSKRPITDWEFSDVLNLIES